MLIPNNLIVPKANNTNPSNYYMSERRYFRSIYNTSLSSLSLSSMSLTVSPPSSLLMSHKLQHIHMPISQYLNHLTIASLSIYPFVSRPSTSNSISLDLSLSFNKNENRLSFSSTWKQTLHTAHESRRCLASTWQFSYYFLLVLLFLKLYTCIHIYMFVIKLQKCISCE